MKDDAYIHYSQLEGTLKVFENLGVFNFEVFDYDDLRFFIFNGLRVVELTLKFVILLTWQSLGDLEVFDYDNLRVFIFDDLRVIELTLK